MDMSLRVIWRIVAWFLYTTGIVLFIISWTAIVIKNHLDTAGKYIWLQEALISRFAILGLPCIGMICIGYALLSKVLWWRIVILFLWLIIAMIYIWVFGWVYIQQALMR